MAKITFDSTRFGKLEIEESAVLQMPAGILGFQNSDRYVMLDHEPDSPFKWLHSVDESDVAFVVTDPHIFFPDYDVKIKKDELVGLDVGDSDELVLLVILSLKSDPTLMTANLQGPIVINITNRKGRQVVLKSEKYTTRHRLFPEADTQQENSPNNP